MVVYAFYIFDRHADCIYRKKWPGANSAANLNGSSAAARPASSSSSAAVPGSDALAGARAGGPARSSAAALSDADDARLVFGTVYSLRNMVRKLGGEEDSFVSFRTGEYKLHYYETPTSLKFVMLTDTRTNNLRIVLHQIYVGLFVEFVVKNPLAPVEHPNGAGVYNEMFEMGLETFISGALQG